MKTVKELHRTAGKPYVIAINAPLPPYGAARFDEAVVAVTGKDEVLRVVYSMGVMQGILVRQGCADDEQEAERIIKQKMLHDDGPGPVRLEYWAAP